MNRVNWIIMRFENIYIHNYHFKTKQLLLWAFQGLINMLIQFNTHLINRWLAVCGKTKHTNNMKRKKGHFFLWYISLSRIQVGYFCIKGWNELRQPYTTEYDYPSYTITLVTESLSENYLTTGFWTDWVSYSRVSGNPPPKTLPLDSY